MAAPFLSLPLSYPEYWIAVWALAALTAAVYAAAARPGWRRALGLGLMAVPVSTAVWSFVNSIPVLSDPGSFIPARSPYRLSSAYIRSILIDVGYLGSGFLLWTWQAGWPRSVRDVAVRLRAEGLCLGPGEGSSVRAGWLLFPVLIGSSIALDWFVRSQVPSLISGDESQVWIHMTVYHTVLISAAAAVTEELVYRAFLLVALRRLIARTGAGDRWAWGGAFVGQAVVFALAHGGYGTFYHVLAPLLFALVAGAVTLRFGIWAAIVLHFLVDVYALGVYAANNTPSFLWVLWVLLIVNAAATVWVSWRWLTRRQRMDDAEAGF